MAYRRSPAFDRPFFQCTSDDLDEGLADRFAQDAEFHVKACKTGRADFGQEIADLFGVTTYAPYTSCKFWYLQEAKYVPQGSSFRIEWTDVPLGEKTSAPTRWQLYDGTPGQNENRVHVEMFPYILGHADIERLGIEVELTLPAPWAYRRFLPRKGQ
jgi:hypothetical protein